MGLGFAFRELNFTFKMMRFFYLAIVGLMFFKSSCSGLNKNIYSGNIHTDTYAHYINDSIQFSVELAGDHFLNKEKKDLKRKLKTYGIKPFKKKVIEIGRASCRERV